MDLSTHVALVTGGTRGIGRAIVQRLLEEGARVALCARSAGDVEAAVQELSASHGDRVFGRSCDVRDAGSVRTTVDAVVQRFGRLSVLVNNAGLGVFAPLGELSVDDWQLQIDTNLGGVFHCSTAALPHLADAGGAWIINVGSLASRNAFAGGVGYNASKFGLLGMTEAMMLDVRYQDIRVSLVMPGSVNTEFRGRTVEEDTWRLTSDDVARAVVDLLRYPANAHVSRVELRPSQPPRN
ncbi:MAG: SDR family oxidoreductase [Gemmatimonadota bacterium]|nr:SDR family oxidoreductase [Gemmatimonadota bacterium]